MSYDLHHGSMLDVLPTLEAESIDSCVTDPPYHLTSVVKRFGKDGSAECKGTGPLQRKAKGFMGQEWDGGDVAFRPETWAEVYRVLKPGAHLVAFSGSRTYHRMACAIEDAGFEIRDMLEWVYACLSDDTEILVGGEWSHYSKATQGRPVLCYDVEHDSYSWSPVESLVVYEYDDIAFRIHSDKTDQIVSRNHRCLTERGGKIGFQIAEEIAWERKARVPVLEGLPELLNSIPNGNEGAGDQEESLREDLRRDGDIEGPEAQAAETRSGKARGGSGLLRVRHKEVEASGMAAEGDSANMFQRMQRQTSGGGFTEACTQGQGGVVRAGRGATKGENDGIQQPILEGWRDLHQAERELPAHQECSMSSKVCCDGTEERVHAGIPADCGDGDRPMPGAHGGGSPRGPRPEQQRTIEPSPIQDEPGSQTVRAPRHTVTHMARIDPIRYVGKVWCVKVSTGAFVARRNGKVFVTGNSGFPKSLDVSKAMDRMRYDRVERLEVTAWIRDARDRAGIRNSDIDRAFGFNGMAGHWTSNKSQPLIPTPEQVPALLELLGQDPPERILRLMWELNGTKGQPGPNWFRRPIDGQHTGIGGAAQLRKNMGENVKPPGEIRSTPATEAARQWSGYGTALKPSHEPIVLARKPLTETSIARQVLETGTGAINVDGCRVGGAGPEYFAKCASVVGLGSRGPGRVYAEHSAERTDSSHPAGRWPPNLIFSHHETCTMDACTDGCPVRELVRQGAPAAPFPAFRYCPKPSKAEREAGLHDREETTRNRVNPGGLENDPRWAPVTRKNNHPTVKPVELMRWLARLVTPPGGTVLEPFGGSGTTGVAAILEGFRPIVVEMMPVKATDPDFVSLIRARMDHAVAGGSFTTPEDPHIPGQGSLFGGGE